MVRTLIPAVIGLIAIVSLSFYEGYKMKDRWGVAGIQAKELSERFAQVPLHIGDWEGEDLPVDEVVRKTAGAVGYVSRRYTHAISGKEVVLWLIVGHSRDITRHTPNICYPSSGFRQAGSQLRHHIDIKNIRADDGDTDDGDTDDGDKGSDGNTANEKLAVFYTAKFEKEDAFSHSIERVFWTFNHPDKNQWEAPEEGARWHYGLSKSLYKLYFTSAVRSEEDTIEENAAVEFAQLMLPAIDAALFPTVAADAIGANGDGANGDGANGDGAVSDTPTTEAEH